ncbi:uncharacterized protein LOC124268579 isoform X2 [Haliotis rubra]|uniref:uncharacterized protein LOC124268579 isoform X2 n=1 Tax=Haliotis rubra TaxID=36100 RepID=UPI001EE5C7E1|nr:uncharacterized protein LOC124268579 isoform X2 [Haliotis rubra]
MLIIVAISVYLSMPLHNGQRSTNWEKDLMEIYQKTVVDVSRPRVPENVDGEDYLDLQQLNLLKPISHFSGLDFDKETADRGKNLTTLRNWANPDGSDRKLLYNGMRYENGSITVPAAGVYHITSHVKFYIEDNRKDDKPSRHSSTRLSAIAPPARHRSCCLRMP